MTAQHQENLVVTVDELVPHHLRIIVERVEYAVAGVRLHIAPSVAPQIIVRRHDGRQPRKAVDHRARPRERGVGGMILQADMQKAALSRAKDLRAVGAAVMRSDVPGLPRKECRFVRKGRSETGQPPDMAHPRLFLLGLRRMRGICPERVEVVIARHHRKGQLARHELVGLHRHWYLESPCMDLGRHRDFRTAVRNPFEVTRGVRRVHPFGIMLPDVADMGREHDIAARPCGIFGHPAHLPIELFDRIEGKTRPFLMPVIDIVLRIGNHRDPEFAARPPGCLRRCGAGRTGKRGEQRQPRLQHVSIADHGCLLRSG